MFWLPDLTNMKILCVFGQHNYGKPERGEGYEYTNFIPAFKRLGHEVLFFESWNRDLYKDLADLNHALLRLVEKEKPDIIFSVMFTYEIWLETWKILGSHSITINWTTDDSWKYNQFSRLVAPVFHCFTTTYPKIVPKYRRDGISQVILTQWAANAENLQPPLPASECYIPVSFVGTAHGKRKSWIHALEKQGIQTKCFGYGWEGGAVGADEIPNIVKNSIISLNFSNSAYLGDRLLPGRKNQIKARIFEVVGYGGFLLTEDAEDLDRYYNLEKEISVFHNPEELGQQIRCFLKNPGIRDSMALAAHKRVCLEHTYDQRLADVLRFALQNKKGEFSVQKHLNQNKIDWGHFESTVSQYKVGRGLNLLKNILVSLFSFLFGPRLGCKISRRLVYETSWRFFGNKTYKASGWPGRLFP
ncbi:MAG: CgeB family protein [Nitrospiria bacterium]